RTGRTSQPRSGLNQPPPRPPPPPPPKPRPPPNPLPLGPRLSPGRASLTVSWRPSISRPLRAAIAASADSRESISTKANPRERPVSRSVTKLADSTTPICPNSSSSSCSDTLKGRLPTYNLTDIDFPRTKTKQADWRKRSPANAIVAQQANNHGQTDKTTSRAASGINTSCSLTTDCASRKLPDGASPLMLVSRRCWKPIPLWSSGRPNSKLMGSLRHCAAHLRVGYFHRAHNTTA